MDCASITSEHSYGDVFSHRRNGKLIRFGSVLKEAVPQLYFDDKWLLTVDADEFIILHPPYVNLAAFVDYLDGIGAAQSPRS